MIATIVSVGVALAGLFLLFSADAGDLAVFGWMFVVLGVVGAVANLLLRARTRQRPGNQRPRR